MVSGETGENEGGIVSLERSMSSEQDRDPQKQEEAEPGPDIKGEGEREPETGGDQGGMVSWGLVLKSTAAPTLIENHVFCMVTLGS